MTRTKTIGLDRRIDITWLDAVAGKVAVGASPKEMRELAWAMLDGVVAGQTSHSARGKTVTVLSHIWSEVPDWAVPLRNRAAALISHAEPQQRLAIHWAMVIATYPFARDIAATIGRLLALQGKVLLSQLTQRLAEVWGERSTVIWATQRTARSMVQWGVLRDSIGKGAYESLPAPISVDRVVSELLLEAVLVAPEPAVLPIDSLLTHPVLFPFKLALAVGDLHKSAHFRIHRQGMDHEVVELAPLAKVECGQGLMRRRGNLT